MLPTNNNTLQVVYTHNMDGEDDSDDRLAFQRGCGACGLCWEILDYVICDLEDAADSYKEEWKMDKYQQRLVRRHLRSLLCVPLFDQRRIKGNEEDKSILGKAFVGVMNIDSDMDLLEEFAELVKEENNPAKACAGMIADILLKPST